MQVQQLMTSAPRACGPEASLCEAVQMMWEGDFGILPVLDDAGHLVGVLTDRDIAIAVGTRNRPASELKVTDVMSRTVRSCHPHAGVAAALDEMREFRVRRLPVVDGEGRLCGILSLNDLVLAAGTTGVPARSVMETIRALSEHRMPSGEPMVAA